MRILIVDDNEFILKIQDAIVRKIATEVVTCSSGQDCVGLLKQDAAFDLVLMDMQMPVMNGCQTTETIRSFNSDIPIYALTGNESVEDENACLRAGMNGTLYKPLNLRELTGILTSV